MCEDMYSVSGNYTAVLTISDGRHVALLGIENPLQKAESDRLKHSSYWRESSQQAKVQVCHQT